MPKLYRLSGVANQIEVAVLALDIGTSSCRASLYDVNGEPVAGFLAQTHYTPRVTIDGGAELDAEVLFEHVCATIDELLARGELPRILAVGTSCFWHSLLGVDRDGQPITPVYLWLDNRARLEIAGLRDKLDGQAIHSRTGCVLHWSYWPAKLAWLRHTQPGVCKRAARWLSFGELLLERLTGQVGVSVSMASGTGLLNIHTCEWDPEMLEALDLDQCQVSPILGPNDMAASPRWPALASVPWLAAVGDGACSNLGADCASPDRFALMVGTSGAERAIWEPQGDFDVPWGVWCYRLDRRRVVMGGALNDGGSLLDWLRATLQLSAASMSELGSMQPDSHGLSVLPFWGGERSTRWAADARGAIVGLRLSTRPVDILQACLEAVALRFAEIDQLLLAVLPQARDVVATGAALLNTPVWMQIMADTLGRPLLVSAEAEASSRGAALLALETIGSLSSPLGTRSPNVVRRFEPVPTHTDIYRAAAKRQRSLYKALVR